MGYIAVRGGEEAILNAETLLLHHRIGGDTLPVSVSQIQEQLHLAVDRVMSEGGFYAPEIAAAAFKQAAGDTLEAAFLLRAYRSSVPRIGSSEVIDTNKMRICRRISAAFKEIPGGQILGSTPDYTHRLIRFDVLENEIETREKIRAAFEDIAENNDPIPETYLKVVEYLRKQGLLTKKPPGNGQPVDITLQSLDFPAPRSARLQALARGETGAILTLAYTSMRGYGQIHPVIGELRVGDVPVFFKGFEKEPRSLIGWVRVTECEVIAQMVKRKRNGRPQFTLGYGLCFGHNEIKAISMAILDRALMSNNPKSPPEDQEFVLSHIDGIESSGFCLHYKLPHYVTFQATLQQLRDIRNAPIETERR